jgi:hypothetical protein
MSARFYTISESRSRFCMGSIVRGFRMGTWHL